MSDPSTPNLVFLVQAIPQCLSAASKASLGTRKCCMQLITSHDKKDCDGETNATDQEEALAWQGQSGPGAEKDSWSCIGMFRTGTGSWTCWAETVQTSCFKNRSLDLPLSDYPEGNPEYVQTTPAGHIRFRFLKPEVCGKALGIVWKVTG